MSENVCFIDTHCHLDNPILKNNILSIIKNCIDLNINKIINPSISIQNFDDVISIANSMVYPALGLHPVFLNQHEENHLNILDHYLNVYRQKIIAIGEIGIDLFLNDLDINKQTYYFTEQLKLAQKYDLPVIIHARKSHDLIFKYLKQIKVKGGIIHAFNGSFQQAERFIQLNFKLGFGGSLTYSKALNIRKLAQYLPLETIVLETDSPDMPPSYLEKNQINSPVEIYKIAENLAEIKNISLDSVRNQTYLNVIEIFKLK